VHALESVLKKDPLHLGANHYYIHAIEASFHPERALMSAERLKTLMPTSGHILHMPSHIYLLVGDYHQAALSNEQAIAVDRAYIQKYGIRGIYAMHYLSHNLYFLSRAYSMEGRFADAKRAADELANLYMPHFQHMPELEYYATAAFFTLFRFHDWQSILTVQEPPSAMQIAHALWHFARAYAYFQLQDFDQGFQEQEQFLQGIKRIPQGAKFGYNQAEKVLKIARLYLEAGLAQVRNDLNQAIEITKEAVQEQDTLHYNEPPDWYFPIRETLGGLLLRAGRYSEAEQVFRDDLDKHPRNGRSLFGLMVSLKEQGRDSYWVDEAFKKAWFYSDTTISVDKL
jgi:tetratricopeptide (TPR) repeat protein